MATPEKKNKILPGLKFNLKITDISDLSNPFAIFEDRPITDEGVLCFDEKYLKPTNKLNVNPCILFPWLKEPREIEKKTIKIEVVFQNDLIMCRYLHLNKLYPIEYSKIALQISNNIYQNQYLLYKENKIQVLYQKENPAETNRSEVPAESNENESSRKPAVTIE